MVGVVKLGYFVVERLAEPVSARLEQYASRSAAFRAGCLRFASWQHQLEYSKALRRHAREARASASAALLSDRLPDAAAADLPALPEPLSEKEATQQACEVLGEGFLWSVGLGLLLHESLAEREHELAQEAQIEKLVATQRALAQRVELMEAAAERQAAADAAVRGGARGGRLWRSWWGRGHG